MDPLSVVPLDDREEVMAFDMEADGTLAAGFLRSRGIAAELGSQDIPGLVGQRRLWVRREQAAQARHLLAQAQSHRPHAVDE